jgi:hypothetical protein
MRTTGPTRLLRNSGGKNIMPITGTITVKPILNTPPVTENNNAKGTVSVAGALRVHLHP